MLCICMLNIYNQLDNSEKTSQYEIKFDSNRGRKLAFERDNKKEKEIEREKEEKKERNPISTIKPTEEVSIINIHFRCQW